MKSKGIFTGFVAKAARTIWGAASLFAAQSDKTANTLRTKDIGAASRVLAFAVLVGTASTAMAGTYSCGPYPTDDFQVLDGNNLPPGITDPTSISSLSFTGDCTIKDFPLSVGGFGSKTTLLNFNLPDKSAVIVLDNVYYTGNMSCSNLPPGVVIWWINGAWNSIDTKCQKFIPPLDGLRKSNPAGQTTQSVGIPFTYTLTMPEMVNLNSDGTYTWTGQPDTADVTGVDIYDDLSRTATGADLSYLKSGTTAYLKSSTGAVTSVTLTDLSTDAKHLHFQYGTIPAGSQLVIELQVVLDNTAANVPGTQFSNRATWTLSKLVINQDGSTTPINGVNGMDGVTDPMTIVGPDLVVTKTSPSTTINLGGVASFTVDVVNQGGGSAYNTTITDNLPQGMCASDPRPSLSAEIYAADGTLVSALGGSDYQLTWNGPTTTSGCQLTLTLNDTAAARIGPNQDLKITYQAEVDATGVAQGASLTNVAGATQWFNGASSNSGRVQYGPYTLSSDGTAGTLDYQDAYTLTAALAGYYFQKTVKDVTTGAYLATVAFPGDNLHYTLLIQNFTWPALNGITVTDALPTGLTSISNVTVTPSGGSISVTQPSGGSPGSITVSGLSLPGGSTASSQIQIDFDATVDPNVSDGTVISNQASLTGTDSNNTPWTGVSDDPYIGSPEKTVLLGSGGDKTDVTIKAPGALSKANPAPADATIGQQFSYLVKVPASPTDIPLYDVHIFDTLPSNVSYVSAQVVSGGMWTLSKVSSTTPTCTQLGCNLELYDPNTGIDIPAGGQAVVEVTVQLANAAINQGSTPTTFTNSANYSYLKLNGDASTQAVGGGETTPNMTVLEPALTATKTVANVTSGKVSTDPAVAGDTLRYTVTIANNGTSEAYDADVTDMLPANVSLVPNSASATFKSSGASVGGFVPTPTTLPSGAVDWGSQNGDGSLDIPAGESLVLAYNVTVNAVDGAPIINSVSGTWTSLNGPSGGERTGADCSSGVAGVNDYCFGPKSTSINTVDPNAIAKSVVSDSWDDGGVLSTGTDSTLRVGDTVVYRLAVTLHEGLNPSVQITDTLDPGLAFDGVVSINGDTTAPFSSVAPFSYSDFTAPAISGTTAAGNTVTWNLGDVTNTADNDPSNDTFVIEYRARVVKDVLAQAASTSRNNNVSLSYTGSDPASASLASSATITALQPIMRQPTKTATGFTSPANVDIVSDVMPFQLQSCNDGSAPAYGAKFTDVLASQMDEGSVSITGVTVGATALTAPAGYTYTYDTATRTMTFVLNTPVNPGECATIDYSIGFHKDVAPNQTWNNSVTLDEYWSLPTPTTTGQKYGPLTSDPFVMTNTVPVTTLTKVVASPTNGVVTIGQDVDYTITIPATNAQLSDVVVTDTLDDVLQYVGATAVDDLGNSVSLNDNSSGNVVSLTIAQIPAGRQAIITLHTRVANNGTVNDKAGYSFNNTASYTYTGIPAGSTSGTSGSLTIVEPRIDINKSVTPSTSPGAGDVLSYTVDLTAGSGASYSTAYDVVLTDTLSPGLAYVSGSSKINGTSVADPSTSGQTLTWPVSNMDPGTTATVTYQVKVQDSVTAGQVLSNSATVRWTSLSGASADERNGSGTPSYNNYFSTASISLPPVGSNYSLSKEWSSDTYAGGSSPEDVRVGDFVEYKLTLGLQEGTTNNVVLTDLMPAGMVFDSTVSITPGSSNLTYSGTGKPSTGATGNLTWDLGTVVNVADGVATDDTLVIVYRARLLNNSALPQMPVDQPLANQASLSYSTATGTVTVGPQTVTIHVQQPMLAVTKGLVSTSGGDQIIDAGEAITYKADIKNTGDAPAYDPVLSDTLPAGLRQGGVTTTSIQLLDASSAVVKTYATPMQPTSYDSTAGVATWNFDTGVADDYTIPSGYTLHVEYRVTADADLGAGLSLPNSASVSNYYSFDNDAVPPNGMASYRQVYGPTPASTYTLTSTTPGVLKKENPAQLTAAIGQPFTYTITVPEVPATTALYDVQVIDTLPAGVEFVSTNKVSTWGTWAPVGSVSGSILTITGSGTGIDIPAGQQAQIAVTVVLKDDTTVNPPGRTFTNTATYTYVNDIGQTFTTPSVQTDPPMTIVGPNLTLTKSGPSTMRAGVPGTFTLDVQNTGGATAWNTVITDILPKVSSPAAGGMCDVAPTNVTVQNYQADGTASSLVNGTDFTVNFAGAPDCTWTVTMTSAAAAIASSGHLTITYDASLDANTASNLTLTNVAGATQYLSADPSVSGNVHTYTNPNPTDGTTDYQDAWSVTTESPVLTFTKTVYNVTTGQSGASASPGDTLKYTLTIQNISSLDATNFTLTDELDRLNTSAMFVPGSLKLLTVPTGADATLASATGGTKGTGLVHIEKLSIDAQGGANDTQVIEFQATLVPVITSGTKVLNQGQIGSATLPAQDSDDPSLSGTSDPTETLIAAAPVMQVQKTSQDITGDTTVLLPGDTLRYTITVKNIGTESATGVTLSDLIPNFTTYVGGTTRLNGTVVPDPSAGVSALQNGILINSPADPTAGAMPADASSTTNNVATVTFDVKVNSGVVYGTFISNQAFVNGSGVGSGPFQETPSDDPNTATLNDPTRDIVGDVPQLDATKTVSSIDNNGNNVVDAGDTLHYVITVNNFNAIPATGVVLTDDVPTDTTYVPKSVTLNGTGVPDSGGSPLVAGIAVNSPGSTSGTVAPGTSAVVTFDVVINSGAAAPAFGTVISNQGYVTSAGVPGSEATDADGDDSNGDQPTKIKVGSAEQIAIVKAVTDLNGNSVLPGDTLQYTVTVTNTGAVPATLVTITDDLTPLAGKATYVTGSASLDGSATGVSYSTATSTLTADYAANHGGDLAPGDSATLTFKVLLVNDSTALPSGYAVLNTARVTWSSSAFSADASASVDIGAIPGSATLNGRVWYDANFDNVYNEPARNKLAGWTVALYQNGTRLGSTTSNVDGLYTFSGLAPTVTAADQYEIRFTAPGASATTAKLGLADSSLSKTPYTDGMQVISGISAASGDNLQELNLPIDPNGVVYDALSRAPIVGAKLVMTPAGSTVPVDSSCFLDPAQQGQVTLSSGFYKFDLKVGDLSCPAGDYVIRVTPPAGYQPRESGYIPPNTSDSATPPTSAYSVATCSADAVSTPTGYCEAQASEYAPTGAGTDYYLKLALNTPIPGASQIFNNHIPLDPTLQSAVAISKTSGLVNVSRGGLVPYTITVQNTLAAALPDLSVIDMFPPGFKYVKGSSRVDGARLEPTPKGRALRWDNLQLLGGSKHTIKLVFAVGSGVSDGEYVNRAQAIDNTTGDSTDVASATVRVIPDPTFDCTDVIGKVFDDANLNGYQDDKEKGLPGVRVVTARGLIATTDEYGRFHITCAVAPDENRGSNFILKLDDRSLPSGYRVTTENPRVQRATRGKMLKFNFGATIHHVVRLDIADGVFEPDSTKMRLQWKPRLDLLLDELEKGPSVLRLSYLADVEEPGLVKDRLAAVKKEIEKRWEKLNCCHELTIETEIFWRRGGPPDR